jgi:predicted aspartyl protease
MASLDMTPAGEGVVSVPVSINGTMHKFLVDTAGMYSQIASDAAQKIGLKEAGQGPELYGAGGKIHLGIATADSFKIGNNEAKNFHLGIRHVQQGTSSAGASFDGFLAPDMLSLFDVELDFAKKKMNLFSQDHCPGKVVYWTQSGYAVLPFRFATGQSESHITLDMTLDGHEMRTDFDTGSSDSTMRKKAAVQIFGLDENSPGVTKSPNATAEFPVLRKQFGSLTFGGLAVQNPIIDILPSTEEDSYRMEHSEKSRDDPIYGSNLVTENLTLGMNVIGKLHVFIAYKEHKVYITDAGAH